MISAVIVAGGKGKRMGHDVPKQYIKLNGREILSITLGVFESSPLVDEVILVISEGEVDYCLNNIVKKYGFKKVKDIIKGGAERQDSVYNGLLNCSPLTDIVLIHDGVRPFVDKNIIEKSIESARIYGACAAGVYVKDTIKIVDGDKFIISTPDRGSLIAIQTPQTFKFDLVLEAHKRARENKIYATDDTALVELMGHRVKIIEGSYCNIKITTPEDLIFAKLILNSRA